MYLEKITVPYPVCVGTFSNECLKIHSDHLPQHDLKLISAKFLYFRYVYAEVNRYECYTEEESILKQDPSKVTPITPTEPIEQMHCIVHTCKQRLNRLVQVGKSTAGLLIAVNKLKILCSPSEVRNILFNVTIETKIHCLFFRQTVLI